MGNATSSVKSESSGCVVDGLDGLMARLGTELGVSGWIRIDQDQVNSFATLTGDEQWIHVDPIRAQDGPFGAVVQHGFFTLSMATCLLDQVLTVNGVSAIINYGLNKVRFPSPVRVGTPFRMKVSLAEAVRLPDAMQVVYNAVYEIEGQQKPACVAELVFRYVA